MGVVLVYAIVLAVCSAWLELKIYKAAPILRAWTNKSILIGLAFSIFLSWAFGKLFNADGLAVLLGGVMSSMMTEPVHEIKRRMFTRNTASGIWMAEAKELYTPIFRWVGKKLAKVVFIPIWAPVSIHMWYKKNFAK